MQLCRRAGRQAGSVRQAGLVSLVGMPMLTCLLTFSAAILSVQGVPVNDLHACGYISISCACCLIS